MSNEMSFGDRMKRLEGQEANRILLPGAPIVARLDGRSFHTVTRKLERPFSKPFHDVMQNVTQYLVDKTGAVIGYTQSDEISLVWPGGRSDAERWFDGRVSKLTSLLAAMASVRFNQQAAVFKLDVPELAVFDCRVWTVPNEDEAVNALVWREHDASKNSIQMVAQANFSAKAIHKLNGAQLQEKLWAEKGINWNDYPAWMKRGSYFGRRTFQRPFTEAQLAALPGRHAARTDPSVQIARTQVARLEMPQLSKVVNRNAVVFQGDDPLVGE